MAVDAGTIERWMAGYERAWTSNEPSDIAGLFTEDASYYAEPHLMPKIGADIVQDWLERKDEPGDWSFRWETLATTDDTAFVRGWTDYSDGKKYHNLWVVRLAPDGRCSEFTEWWVAEKPQT